MGGKSEEGRRATGDLRESETSHACESSSRPDPSVTPGACAVKGCALCDPETERRSTLRRSAYDPEAPEAIAEGRALLAEARELLRELAAAGAAGRGYQDRVDCIEKLWRLRRQQRKFSAEGGTAS